MSTDTLQLGWATADITPDRPVFLRGQFHARISTHVDDPLSVTALVLTRGDEQVTFVAVDRAGIEPELLDPVRARLRAELPEVDPDKVVLNATHTHTAPEVVGGRWLDPPVPVMDGDEYQPLAVDGIVRAIREAWASRANGGVSWGLEHAIVGHNRRACYLDGSAKMYGEVNTPEFAGMEGADNPVVHLLYTWSAAGELTGVVINEACPSQVVEGQSFVSADFWCETRAELKKRLGPNLYVLPQCSPAGDIAPRTKLRKAAEERMRRLRGETDRQEIANRLADAVERVLPAARQEIHDDVPLRHQRLDLELTRRRVLPEEVEEAKREMAGEQALLDKLRADGSADYRQLTRADHRVSWWAKVEERFKLQDDQPTYPAEVHLVRLGDIAIATNPFELFLDFGLRIEARSPALQTFCVQLAGNGTYLPTERAVSGKSYGAGASSNAVGPEGGQELVEATLAGLEALFAAEPEPVAGR